MKVHLPKPLHGWREFAGEVGIIVLGVLIALGAGQLVNDWQWRNEVAAARGSIGEEIEQHYFYASEMAIAQPCIDRQLQQLEDAVLAPGPYRPVPSYSEGPMTFAFRAPSRSWSDHIWRSVSSDGTAGHFDRNTRFGLGEFYAVVDYMRAQNATADSSRWKLAALTRPIQPDAATRAGLVAEIEQARSIYGVMAVVANQLVRRGENLGFQPKPKDLRAEESRTVNFCRAHHLPLGKVRPQL
jgi:hypothetical protein